MLRGDRLRDLRLKHRFTHEELAERLGLGVRQIARYESGETKPDGDIVARIAEVFQVSTDYLLDLTDAPTPNLDSSALSDKERKVIVAMRGGDVVTAIKEIVGN